MIQILMVVPVRHDSTSFYRAFGPMCDLKRSHEEINLVFAGEIDWAVLDVVDFVFMQRPATAEDFRIAELCKTWEKPLWIDFDDLLFDVPRDNPAYDGYMQPDVRERIAKIIQLATVVTVSTPELKRCFQVEQNPLNQHVYVIPNALSDKLVKKAVPYSHKKLVNWRGTNTHQRDLVEVSAELIEIIRERKDTTLSFVGWNPWFITECVKNNQAIVVPGLPIGDYLDFMVKTNPPIQIVPLTDHMFNRCKSNIAWIEGCLAGAVAIAPEWEEWKRPGILTYKNQEDFKACVQWALDNPKKMAGIHEEGWQYIIDNLLLSKVNEKRWELAEALTAVGMGCISLPDGGKPYPKRSKLKAAEEHVMELE